MEGRSEECGNIGCVAPHLIAAINAEVITFEQSSSFNNFLSTHVL